MSRNEEFTAYVNSISSQLHSDPSFSSFEAMHLMTELTDSYLGYQLGSVAINAIYAGGSLGRSEMLPNSDVDLFVIDGSVDPYQREQIKRDFDKTEVASIDSEQAYLLANDSLVDGNRLVDARFIYGTKNPGVKSMLESANTVDRQVANILAERFYFGKFDYPQKQHTMHGDNIKYSPGSSRDIIFFDWLYRLKDNRLPINSDDRSVTPEIIKASNSLKLCAEVQDAIDLVLTVKNAAVSSYTSEQDWRLRYVNDSSLLLIHKMCLDKLTDLGLDDVDEFKEVYSHSRKIIDKEIEARINNLINNEPSLARVKSVIGKPYKGELKTSLLEILEDGQSHSEITYATWEFIQSSPTNEENVAAFKLLKQIDFPNAWGGIMALVSSSAIEDNMLREIGEWLYYKEPGAYLLKIVSRNPNASSITRQQVLDYYREKEVMQS